jgi:HPt (histidine-containing phosphotransfer) domain-containing protein
MNLDQEINNKYSEIVILDEETMDMLKSFAKGNQEMIQDIIESFEPEASALIKDIKRASSGDNDYDLLRKAAHSLAGISGSIGALRLRQISSDIENFIKAEKLSEAIENLNHLFAAYFDLIETLKKIQY